MDEKKAFENYVNSLKEDDRIVGKEEMRKMLLANSLSEELLNDDNAVIGFMIGQAYILNKDIKVDDADYEKILLNKKLRLMIKIIGDNKAIRHKDLAKKTNQSSQSLTMYFKRHEYWKKYITAESDEEKMSSVIYRLTELAKNIYDSGFIKEGKR